MIDIVAEMVELVNSDQELKDILGRNVFGYRIPQGASLPLAVITHVQTTQTARPTGAWWSGFVSVDFQSDDPDVALALATRMTDVAPMIVGTRATCVVSDCQVESIQPIIDDGWTPTRFRQVVSVELTAREP